MDMPKFLGEEMASKRYGYMCKIDYDYEIGSALGGNKIYPSIKDLARHHTCASSCGIVRVSIELDEVLMSAHRPHVTTQEDIDKLEELIVQEKAGTLTKPEDEDE